MVLKLLIVPAIIKYIRDIHSSSKLKPTITEIFLVSMVTPKEVFIVDSFSILLLR